MLDEIKKETKMVRKKKQIKLKEPVRLREKKLKDGNRSLYLDIYSNGIRKYEYLKLYLVPELTEAEKKANKQTWQIAEQIKAERILALQSRGVTDWDYIKKSSMPVVAWLEKEYENPPHVIGASSKNWRKQTRKMFANYLDTIHKPNMTLEEIDKSVCRGFIAYLRTATNRSVKKAKPISPTTGQKYMMEMISALNFAVREGVLVSNPFKLIPSIERITRDDKEREFLTIDEIKTLMKTPCGREDVKVAFFFSCFTGLRISDVRKITPRHIFKSLDGSGEYINLSMTKTKHSVIVPLSNEAKKWLPEPKGNDIPYFTLPNAPSTISLVLKQWMESAGIDKHITFHCARHSFATMMLTLGTDIYTTSKLLGHNHVSTTEIYAKVIDKKKVESMTNLDRMFNPTITKGKESESNVENEIAV
jgi:integrase